ncbi:hypothetical protein [Bordetella sp. FB-8]|uniref:hypothetical protein n=1 Tax=Bordetella sp. FB-8 TaxID=1159870 RepID=UPI00039DF146|nr:hypothetical protein [Bordetella sp. FB-8]
MLNPVSILLVAILSSVMSVAMLGSLQFAAIPGVRRWIVAGLLWMVSMALVALQSLPYPKFVSLVLSNTLMAYSITLIYEGCRQFQGLRPAIVLPYIGCAGIFLGSCYWLYVSPSFNARVVLVIAGHDLFPGLGAADGFAAAHADQSDISRQRHTLPAVSVDRHGYVGA